MAPISRVEGRFSHQSMNSGFGSQPTKCKFSGNMDGGTLDSSHIATGNFDQLGLEALVFTPAQIHTQEHFCPILGFCSPRASLDVHIGVGTVHVAGEHAAKFQLLQLCFQLGKIHVGRTEQFLVAFFFGQAEQFLDFFDSGVELIDGCNHHFKTRSLPAERLGVFRFVPDSGLTQFEFYLGKAVLLHFIVKDTP